MMNLFVVCENVNFTVIDIRVILIWFTDYDEKDTGMSSFLWLSTGRVCFREISQVKS